MPTSLIAREKTVKDMRPGNIAQRTVGMARDGLIDGDILKTLL